MKLTRIELRLARLLRPAPAPRSRHKSTKPGLHRRAKTIHQPV